MFEMLGAQHGGKGKPTAVTDAPDPKRPGFMLSGKKDPNYKPPAGGSGASGKDTDKGKIKKADKPATDPKLASLIAELTKLGSANKAHKNPKISDLAKKALTAAASLQMAGAHAPVVGGSASPAADAAATVLKNLKAALAADKTATVDPAIALKKVTDAQTKLKTSAQKMVSSAGKLKTKTAAVPAKGTATKRLVARAGRVSTKLSDAGSKLLTLASKKMVPKAVTKQPTGKGVKGKSKSSVGYAVIGDDLSDAQAQVAAAQQAVTDAQTEVSGVTSDLDNARQARDNTDASDPNYDSVQDDYTNAINNAMALIFSDTSVADAQAALNDANALLAAVQGLPPPDATGTSSTPAPPPVTPTGGATITPPTATITAGQTTKLSFTVGGAPPVPTPAVAWASSNSSVATVDQTGLVTAIMNGTANITAMQGKALAQCQVTVQGGSPPSISPPQLQIMLGQPSMAPLQFMANGRPVVPSAGAAVNWTSSNPSAVTVDSMGNVNATAAGFATITATMGPVTAQCQVTVTDPNAMQQGPMGGGSGGGGSSGGGGDDGSGGGDDGGPQDDGSGGGDDGYSYDDGSGMNAGDGGGDSSGNDDGSGGGDGSTDDGSVDQGDESVWDDTVSTNPDDNDGVVGGLNMLGSVGFDASSMTKMIPGLLSGFGGALSGTGTPAAGKTDDKGGLKLPDMGTGSGQGGGKSSGTDPMVQMQMLQMQQKQKEDEESTKQFKLVAWIVGGLAALGLGGAIVKKVLA